MDRKYKICHICSYYETPIFSDLVHHQKSFTEPRVFYYQHFNHQFANGDESYVDKCPCYNRWERFFFHLKQRKAIQKYKDIYISSNIELNFAHSLFTNGFVAYQIKQSWNIPYIVTIQNTDINVFFKYQWLLHKTGLMILKGAAQIIIASDSYKKTLLERYVPKKYRNEIEEKIKVIPYGINDFYIDNKFESRKKLRNEVNVLSIGRVDKNKNHILICKALKKEKSLGKKINLKIIGEGKNKKIVKKINKYPFVQYYSYMDKKELLRQYRKSDIFILTSKTETFGLVYAEALSQGLPIIYTQDQGFDKQLPEGLVGYHTSGRVRQLRKDFLKVIENYDKLQKNCVKATERFEWKNINVQYLNIYEDILK